jgi:hypothetical protein
MLLVTLVAQRLERLPREAHAAQMILHAENRRTRCFGLVSAKPNVNSSASPLGEVSPGRDGSAYAQSKQDQLVELPIVVGHLADDAHFLEVEIEGFVLRAMQIVFERARSATQSVSSRPHRAFS